jgi:hypothetical protein
MASCRRSRGLRTSKVLRNPADPGAAEGGAGRQELRPAFGVGPWVGPGANLRSVTASPSIRGAERPAPALLSSERPDRMDLSAVASSAVGVARDSARGHRQWGSTSGRWWAIATKWPEHCDCVFVAKP